MKKALLVTNIPNPYRIPLYNALSDKLSELNIQLKVIFGAPGYKRRFFELEPSKINFEFEILDDKGHTFSNDGEKTYFLYKGLNKVLRNEKPDLIFVAGFSSATMKIFRYSLFSGIPYIIISGTILLQGRNSGFLRKLQRKILAQKAAGFVAYGNLAKEYLVDLGVPSAKVFIGRNTVDTDFFKRRTLELKKSAEIKDYTVFTYLGYLVPRKNVKRILEAARIVFEKTDKFRINILGDGISKNELEDYCNKYKLNDIVTFYGFIQQDDLPGYFAQTDALLFQTDYDIWGLVLNEAMSAGIPCLAAPQAGATYDLIENGVNGFITDYTKPENAAEQMLWIMNHPAEAEKMGEKAAKFIDENAGIKHSVNGYLAAVNYVMAFK